MEFSIRVLVVVIVVLIVALVIIFIMSQWAQGSSVTIGNFFEWIQNIIGKPLNTSDGGNLIPGLPGAPE